MHKNVQWANHVEEKRDLLCVPQIDQLGPMTVSQRKETSAPHEEEFSN